MDTPFFSIIIPTYNRSRFLLEAINSVYKQSFSDWELIIVDDGSTDNTKKQVQLLENRKTRYTYTNKVERSRARNIGIDMAKGQYVCFLDDDDIILPNHLHTFYEHLSNYISDDVIYFSSGYTMDKGSGKKAGKLPWLTESDFRTLMVFKPSSMFFCFPKSVFRHGRFPNFLALSEDFYLLCELINMGYSIRATGKRTCIIRLHPERSLNKRTKYQIIKGYLTRKLITDHLMNGKWSNIYLQKETIHERVFRDTLISLNKSIKTKHFTLAKFLINLSMSQAKDMKTLILGFKQLLLFFYYYSSSAFKTER